jgi:transcriptional regulator with XRE-family HTH domain
MVTEIHPMIATRRRAAKTRLVLDTEKMKALRLKLGLSMDDAARRAGFASRQQWYQIESGNVTNIKLETLNAIAAALGVKAKDLLK